MMKLNVFERRCAELKEKLAAVDTAQHASPVNIGEKTYNLGEAAEKLGVSYGTARRLLGAESNVRRYSNTDTGPVYPGTQLKRFQRVRMTWVIPESAIERVVQRMRGSLAA